MLARLYYQVKWKIGSSPFTSSVELIFLQNHSINYFKIIKWLEAFVQNSKWTLRAIFCTICAHLVGSFNVFLSDNTKQKYYDTGKLYVNVLCESEPFIVIFFFYWTFYMGCFHLKTHPSTWKQRQTTAGSSRLTLRACGRITGSRIPRVGGSVRPEAELITRQTNTPTW